MSFPSRVNTSHTRVVGYPVYRQHVGRGPGVDVVRVGIPTEVIEAGYHLVLQPLVDYILPPEIAHPILHPFEILDGHPAGVG